MKFELVSLSEAKGKILGHNIAALNGRRMLRKGKPLTDNDLEGLRTLGRTSVYVALIEENDVDENTAASRVAEAICGPGLEISRASVGRANLLSKTAGLLRVDVDRLTRLNGYAGITLATLLNHSTVRLRQIVATVKVIPYAVPESIVSEVETISSGNRQIIYVDALPSQSVGLILSGSNSLQERLISDFSPLRERVDALGSSVARTDFVSLDDDAGETALTETLRKHVDADIQMILIAGETAIMDEHDIVPQAVVQAGGVVEAVGAPVDPGNLLMLAYINDIPVVGAPGCARSRKENIVDWILPRLLAGDRLTRGDIIELGHGGLLQDVPERGMPREGKEVDSNLDKNENLMSEVIPSNR
jgi:molybdenum cofactor cytidylyltransferase